MGEERYAEYERAQDFAYQWMYQVAEQEGLPRDAAQKVYEMKQVAEAQAQRVRTDPALTPQQRTAALAGIRAETQSSIRGVLGDKGFQLYLKEPVGGMWLGNISPGR